MRINLIRHSTTSANEEGLVSGCRVDRSLSPQGIKIIEDLKAQGIYPEDPGVLYASGMKRAIETIQLIYPGREVHKRPGINERDFGDLEYYTREEALEYNRTHPWMHADSSEADEDLDYKPNNGESTREVIERTKREFPKLVDEFIEKGYDLVTICGHGAFFRDMAYAYKLPVLGGLGPDKFLDNGKGVKLEVEKDGDDLDIKIVGFIGGEKAEDVLINYITRYKEN